MAASQGIALRIGELVKHRGDGIPYQAYIAALLASDAPHPALDMDFFTRAIHLPVVGIHTSAAHR